MMNIDRKTVFNNPIVQVLIWAGAFSLAGFFTVPALLREFFAPSHRWAFKINGNYISDLDVQYETHYQKMLIDNLRSIYGPNTDLFLSMNGLSNNPHVLATEALVRRELLDQLSHQLGVVLHQDYVRQQLHDRSFIQSDLGHVLVSPAALFEPNGHINRVSLLKQLEMKGMTVDMFDQAVERAIRGRIATNIVVNCFYEPSFDVVQEYIERYASKSYSIMSFPLKTFLEEAKNELVSSDQLKMFYDKQNRERQRYAIPEKRAGVMWTFDAHSYDIKVSAQEVESFYKDNKEKLFIDQPTKVQVRMIQISYTSPEDQAQAQEKIRDIQQQLQTAPARFEELARTMSDDKDSAKKGGLMPYFAKGEQSRSLDRAAFSLQADGDISDIFQYDHRYAIVQRVDKKPRTYKSLESVRSDVQEMVRDQLFKKLFQEDIREAIGQGERVDEALEMLVKRKKGTRSLIPLSVKDSSKRLMTLFKANKGDVTFYLEQNAGYLIKVTDVQKGHTPAFESIIDTVQNDWYESRAEQRLKERLMQAREQIGQKTFEEVAGSYGVTLTRTALINPQEKSKSLDDLEQKRLPVEQLLSMSKVGLVLTHQADQEGFLVRLNEVTPATPDKFDQGKYDELKKEVEKEARQRFFAGFVASLYGNAKIEANQQQQSLINPEDLL